MGVRLYSKISSRLWPSNSMLLIKCEKAWDDFQRGENIAFYEYVPKQTISKTHSTLDVIPKSSRGQPSRNL